MAVSLLAASCGGGSPATAPVDDGPTLVEIPSVIGDTVEFASGRLMAIGSPVMVEPVDGLMDDPNIVVEQLPLPGSLVVVGSPVVLKVPGGPPTLARDLTESGAEPTTTTKDFHDGLISACASGFCRSDRVVSCRHENVRKRKRRQAR